jgi:ComF family protein
MGSLTDIVFPPLCAGCDRPGSLLCERCLADVRLIDTASACPRCGAPGDGARCDECSGTVFVFDAARCAALLEPPVSRAVVLLKDAGERRYASLLSGLLAWAAEGWLVDGAVLVPVPASPAAVRRRGFDHALDLARGLSRLTETPMTPVLRSALVADQRDLDRAGRFTNRREAFSLRHGIDVPPHPVLIDDVLTTGATLDAAARVLRSGGALTVRALTVARACRAAR